MVIWALRAWLRVLLHFDKKSKYIKVLPSALKPDMSTISQSCLVHQVKFFICLDKYEFGPVYKYYNNIDFKASRSCGDPGFFSGGSRPDGQKTVWTMLFFIVLNLFYSLQGGGGSMVLLQRKLYFSEDPEKVQHFPRGSNFFQGGPNANFYRKPNNFSRGGGANPLSPHPWISTCPCSYINPLAVQPLNSCGQSPLAI